MGDLSKDINSKFPSFKIKALINILYTANWLSTRQNAYFKTYGISPQQFNILKILKGAGKPIKVQTIKERMIERAPNATRMMDKLFVKKMLERESCLEDRRVVFVKITQQGLKLLKSIEADTRQDLLKNLTIKEAKQLSDLLDKIR